MTFSYRDQRQGIVRWRTAAATVIFAAALVACGSSEEAPNEVDDPEPPPPPPPPPGNVTVAVPLMDMGTSVTYQGFGGGLYPGGSNLPPASHVANQPAVDVSSNFAMISVSMSNGRQEFCNPNAGSVGIQRCTDFSFIGQASSDPSLHSNLVLINTAQGGQPAPSWESPNAQAYDITDSEVSRFGLGPTDVEIAWIKQANRSPTIGLPDSNADAYSLLRSLGNIARALKTRYPNIKQAYLSSRIWSCAQGGLNGEPFAFEGGFSVKWLIAAQINQLANGQIDPDAGDLGLDVAPWLAWGPYLWADGANPRSDGLTWSPSDLEGDCTHPGSAGEEKVGELLLDFFKSSDLTRGWFLD